ncbi:cytosine deaminase [Variovorax sp. LjRoot130]|uniref:cytosine deaminase n=1 Tax=Variovorax sp. LjRoot130 TaxID=3342261 RepID=UPI003ED0F156
MNNTLNNLQWPDAGRVHLANVNVPRGLLDPSIEPAGCSGLTRVDLVLDQGTIAQILPAGSPTDGALVDADGGQCWPTFADLHTHLDKGHIWPRAHNPDGTIDSARTHVRADTTHYWRTEDVEARFEFALMSAYAHGTSAIRTHLDCYVPSQERISFDVFRRLRDRWAGRVELQAVALVSTDLYDDGRNAALVGLVQESGGLLGGVTFRLSDGDDTQPLDGRLDRLFGLARARRMNVDLHVDENGAAASTTLAQIAQAVMRADFQGRVVCGHCCSLSVQEDAVAARTIGLVKDAGITLVSLPLVNQYLQGRRPGATPRWRGIPLLRELQAAGVPVVLASDNCRDPYHAFGDLDLLEVLGGGIRLGHLDTDLAEWPGAITRRPFEAMGVQGGVLRVGSPADLVLFRERSHSELFARRGAGRVVIRHGKRIDAAPPDYRTLDHLFRADIEKRTAP